MPKRVYYLRFTKIKGSAYHRVKAHSKQEAINKFIKGSRFDKFDVRVKKRVASGEKRKVIPLHKKKK